MEIDTSSIIYINIIIIFMLAYLCYDIFTRKKFSTENIGDEIPNFLKFLDENINKINNNIQLDNNKFLEKITINNNKIGSFLIQIRESVDKNNNNVNNINHRIDGLLTSTVDQGQKIKRFENGYDYKIQAEFVLGVIQAIDDLEKDNKEQLNQSTTDAIERLIILLENKSIKRFDIKIDTPYEEYQKHAEVVSIEDTNDSSKNGNVEKIKKQGYYTENNNGESKVIRRASVVVYKFKNKDTLNSSKESQDIQQAVNQEKIKESSDIDNNQVESQTKKEQS